MPSAHWSKNAAAEIKVPLHGTSSEHDAVGGLRPWLHCAVDEGSVPVDACLLGFARHLLGEFGARRALGRTPSVFQPLHLER